MDFVVRAGSQFYYRRLSFLHKVTKPNQTKPNPTVSFVNHSLGFGFLICKVTSRRAVRTEGCTACDILAQSEAHTVIISIDVFVTPSPEGSGRNGHPKAQPSFCGALYLRIQSQHQTPVPPTYVSRSPRWPKDPAYASKEMLQQHSTIV